MSTPLDSDFAHYFLDNDTFVSHNTLKSSKKSARVVEKVLIPTLVLTVNTFQRGHTRWLIRNTQYVTPNSQHLTLKHST